jgi:hypothetical protein
MKLVEIVRWRKFERNNNRFAMSLLSKYVPARRSGSCYGWVMCVAREFWTEGRMSEAERPQYAWNE